MNMMDAASLLPTMHVLCLGMPADKLFEVMFPLDIMIENFYRNMHYYTIAWITLHSCIQTSVFYRWWTVEGGHFHK